MSKQKKAARKDSTALWVVIVVIIAIISGGVFAGYKITKSEKNLPNVYVGDIDVGKMTAAQTAETLEQQGWEKRAATPLKVTTIGGQSFEVDPVRSGVVLSPEAAAEAAHSYGHGTNIIENLITYVKAVFSPVDVNAVSQNIADDYLNACIDKGIEAVGDYMGEDEYTVDAKAAVMTMKKGWKQIEFDKEAFKAAIVSALEKGGTELSYTELSKQLSSPDFDSIHKELEREPVDAYYSREYTRLGFRMRNSITSNSLAVRSTS